MNEMKLCQVGVFVRIPKEHSLYMEIGEKAGLKMWLFAGSTADAADRCGLILDQLLYEKMETDAYVLFDVTEASAEFEGDRLCIIEARNLGFSLRLHACALENDISDTLLDRLASDGLERLEGGLDPEGKFR